MDTLKMEKLKMWSRTVWKELDPDEHEEECVIPSIWINRETRKVRWPMGINAIRAMNELRRPEEKWKTFDLVKVKVSFDSKDDCEEFDFTTSAEITDEEKNSQQGDLEGKRISKKKTYPEFDTGDRAPTPEKQSGKVDTPRSNPVPLPPLPPPPAPKSSLGDSSTSFDETRNMSSSEGSMSPPPTPRVSSGKSMNRVSRSSPEPTPSTSNIYSGRTSSPEHTPSTSNMSKGRRSSPEPTPSRSNMSKGKRSSPEHTPSRSNMSKGRRSSPEPTPSRSNKSKGRRSSPEPPPSRSNKSKGRRSSPEPTPSRSNKSKGRRSSPEPTPSRSNRVSDKYHAAPLRKKRRLPSPSILENQSRESSWSSKSRSRSRSSRYRSRSRSSRYSARSRRTRSRSLRRPNHRSRSPGATSRKKTKSRNADHEKSEVKFQRRILYLLAEIRDLLKKDNMRSLQDYRFKQLDTIEDFLSKDQDLENDAEIVSCKRYIMQIGGKNWTDHLKKAMLRCLTNKLMSEMNMKGDSNLFKIIRDAVVTCSSHEGATESSIWKECGTFLKYAPERLGGVSRKKD